MTPDDVSADFKYAKKEKTPALKGIRYGNVLLDAQALLNGKRQLDYGAPRENFSAIADAWTWYCKHRHVRGKFSAFDVANMMALFKQARIATGGKDMQDSYTDACGYLSLAFDLRQVGDSHADGVKGSDNTCEEQ